jgi:hypothetical protein
MTVLFRKLHGQLERLSDDCSHNGKFERTADQSRDVNNRKIGMLWAFDLDL